MYRSPASRPPARRLAVVLLGAVAALGAAVGIAGAQASVTWKLPSSPIYKTDIVLDGSIGALTSGATDVVFIGPTRRAGVDLVQRDPGGSFGAARWLALGAGVADQATPAVDGAGDLLVAYSTTSAARGSGFPPEQVFVRIGQGGGALGRPQDLSGGLPAGSPALAVAPDGAAVVAFDQLRLDRWDAVVATRPPGGTFSVPAVVGDIGPASAPGSTLEPAAPMVAIDPAGDFVVVSDGGDRFGHVTAALAGARGGAIVAATGTVRGGPRGARTLTVGAHAAGLLPGSGDVSVAIGAGRAVLVAGCAAALAPPGGSFQPAQRLSDACDAQLGVAATVTSDGRALVAFGDGQQSSIRLQVFAAAPGQAFGKPETVFDHFGLFPPVLAAGPHGDALLAFMNQLPGDSGDFDQIRAAVSRSDGAFGQPTLLSHQPPAIILFGAAAGPSGQLDVAWGSGSADGLFVATGSGG